MSNPSTFEATFTIRKLNQGGVEVLLEGDSDVPRRHICDFRSDDEARMWIAENVAKSTQTTRSR